MNVPMSPDRFGIYSDRFRRVAFPNLSRALGPPYSLLEGVHHRIAIHDRGVQPVPKEQERHRALNVIRNLKQILKKLELSNISTNLLGNFQKFRKFPTEISKCLKFLRKF